MSSLPRHAKGFWLCVGQEDGVAHVQHFLIGASSTYCLDLGLPRFSGQASSDLRSGTDPSGPASGHDYVWQCVRRSSHNV